MGCHRRLGRDDRTRGYLRDAWSPADLELSASGSASEAARRGLDLREDRNGNLWAWWGDPSERPGVVTGSHLDSVRQGGAFDGPLGVVSAFAALDMLREPRASSPRRPSGSPASPTRRAPGSASPCMGPGCSPACSTPDRRPCSPTTTGDSLADAMPGRRDPDALGRDAETLATRRRFVELHVEQGRDLVDRDGAGRRGQRPSGRTAAGGSTSAARPTTRAPPGWTTAATRCCRFARTVLRRPQAGRAARRGGRRSAGSASRPNGANAVPSWSAPGWTPEAATRTRRRAGRRLRRARGRRADGQRGVVDPGRRTSTRTCATRVAAAGARPRSWRRGPATTPGSWRPPACPARCCSFATRPASRTPRTRHAGTADCLAGVDALADALEDSVPSA